MDGRTRSNPRETSSWTHRRWAYIAPPRIKKRIAAGTGGEQQGSIHVSKHHAPNGGTTSRTPPSCRSNSESRLSPRDKHQLQKSEGNDEHALATPPRRGMTTTGATAAGPAKAEQDFHPRVAHLHTSRDLAIPSKYAHTAATAAPCRRSHNAEGRQPAASTARGKSSATPPPPSLDGEPQPPHSSGNVQDHPRRPSPTPRDGLAVVRHASPRRTPKPAPPGGIAARHTAQG